MRLVDTLRAHIESTRIPQAAGSLLTDAVTVGEREADLRNRAWSVRSHRLRILYQEGRFAEVERLLSEYVSSVQVASGAALNDFGVILAEQGEPMDALSFLFQALQGSTPAASAPLMLGNLAYVLFGQHRLEDCAAVCDYALELAPEEQRAHYLLSVVESTKSDIRRRGAARIVQPGDSAQVFQWLRLNGEPMIKHGATIAPKMKPQVRVVDSVPLSRSGTHWGVLVTYRNGLWCGLSQQSGGGGPDQPPVMPVPETFWLVQRRGWVRVPVTGAVARIEVRAPASGRPALEVVKLIELNLSAGGAAVRTMPSLPRHSQASLFLSLEDDQEFEVPARVVRVSRADRTAEPGETHAALEFTDLPEPRREQIVRFIHRIQLDRKRREAYYQRESGKAGVV